MNWFTRLFRRKPKPEPTPARPKAGGDIIGRQRGQKRNRVHVYRQPFGYPIRFCDWVMVNVETLERIGEAQGLNGPAELLTLDMALDWAESTKGAIICKHCRALAQGKRGPVMGEVNHGHGTGAPLP